MVTMYHADKKVIIALIVAFLMVLSSLAVLSGMPVQSSNLSHNASPAQVIQQSNTNAGHSSIASPSKALLSKIYSYGVPNKDVYLPNFNAASSRPTYHKFCIIQQISGRSYLGTTDQVMGHWCRITLRLPIG